MRSLLALALLLAPSFALAQTRTTGDAQVLGAMGAGTVVPRAPLEIMLSSTDAYALAVSSPDGTSLFLLDRQAKAGLGLTPGTARLDVAGKADSGQVALELRSGNSSSTVSSAQIAFGDASGFSRASLRTRAAPGQYPGNTIDFFLWKDTDGTSALGSFQALSLQEGTSASTGAVQVSPASGWADAELEVSSGSAIGGGVILRAYAGQHACMAALKTDIAHLGGEGADRAARDVAGLMPATFRYKGEAPGTVRKGLIYEETPESVHGAHETVVVDQRVLNVELALQAAHRRIAALEAEIARLEKEGRGR